MENNNQPNVAEPVVTQENNINNEGGQEDIATPQNDNDNSNEENEDELEFDDNEENQEKGGQGKKKEKKKEMTAEEKRLAFQRRQQEKEAKRLEEEKRKELRANYEKGLLKGSKGINKFTGEKILDKHDIEEYEIMLEMEEKGLNPEDDFAVLKYMKEKAREEEKNLLEKEAEEKRQQEKVQNDIKEFSEAYPDVDLEKVLTDTEFTDFASGLLDDAPLVKVYETFIKITAKTNKIADEKARKKFARSVASPNTLSSEVDENKVSKYASMSEEEFEKQVELAKQGKLSKRY